MSADRDPAIDRLVEVADTTHLDPLIAGPIGAAAAVIGHFDAPPMDEDRQREIAVIYAEATRVEEGDDQGDTIEAVIEAFSKRPHRP